MTWQKYAFTSPLAASVTAIRAKIASKDDKLSLAFTIVLAAVILGENISSILALGAALMAASAPLTIAS